MGEEEDELLNDAKIALLGVCSLDRKLIISQVGIISRVYSQRRARE